MFSSLVFVASVLTAPCCFGNPIVLDDLDVEAFSGTNAHKGSYAPCLKDAYKGQFVHDWARDKGMVSATYSFDPPKDGCYLVEEHHPGSDYQCSRYLPENAQLKVGFCRGKTADISIDQSRNGGKWNTLGRWPFFKGNKGFFTMANSRQETCSASDCFWVADAFRVTWLGRDCSQPVHSPVQKETEANVNTQAEESSTMVGKEDDLDSTPARGTVTLTVATLSGDSANLKLKLKNDGVIETALQAHFGYKAVNLLSLDITSARRLTDSFSAASNYRIEALFEGYGDGDQNKNDQMLMQQVQAQFDAKDAGIQVKSVSVSFESPPTGKPVGSPEEEASFEWIALGAGLVAGAFVLGMFACYMRKLTAKKALDTAAAEHDDVSMYPSKDPEKATELKPDEDTLSVSTAPPPSTDSDGCCSETGSATPAATTNPEMP